MFLDEEINNLSGGIDSNRPIINKLHVSTVGKHSTRKSEKLIARGMALLGTPYRLGAKPYSTRAFDCSSFIQYLYKDLHVVLPRTSRQQSLVGLRKTGRIHRGDILFFTSRARRHKKGIAKISHVGIALGNNKMLHSCKKKGVTVTDLRDPITSIRSTRWIDYFMFAKRL